MFLDYHLDNYSDLFMPNIPTESTGSGDRKAGKARKYLLEQIQAPNQ